MIAFSPMAPILTDQIPKGPDWGHQLKWDGYRIIAWVDNGKVELYTRNMLPKNHTFPELVEALAKLTGTFLLDGEAVILDSATNRPSFQKLQQRNKKSASKSLKSSVGYEEAQYIIFDLLKVEEEDLRQFSFKERNERLQKLAAAWEQPLFLTDLFADGEALWEWVKQNKWEGIVSKRMTSVYKSGKEHRDWYKRKTIMEMDVEIVGILMKEGRLSSLVMSKDGIYKGRNSSGLNERIKAQLAQLATEKTFDAYFSEMPEGLRGETVRWLNKPFHAEVSAAEITEVGTLRQPRIISLSFL